MAALGSARGWIRTDGLPFADMIGVSGGTTGLVNGQIYYPPAIDELGAPIGMGFAWGGLQDGSPDPGDMCSDWTSSSAGASGIAGDPSSGSGMWTYDYAPQCNQALSLYCFGTDLSAPVTVAAPTGRRAFISAGSFDPCVQEVVGERAVEGCLELELAGRACAPISLSPPVSLFVEIRRPS